MAVFLNKIIPCSMAHLNSKILKVLFEEIFVSAHLECVINMRIKVLIHSYEVIQGHAILVGGQARGVCDLGEFAVYF